jgi:hypothetical protein
MRNGHLFRWADGSVRVDVSLLYPPFVALLDDVLDACEARGRRYYAIRGYDSPDAQKALFLASVAGTGGKAAPPWRSQHQVGLAVDFNLDEDMARAGLQLPKTPRTAKHFRVLVEEARRAGLHSGADYNDSPHVGWNAYISGSSLAPLRKVWESTDGDERARLLAVWQHVSGHRG